MGFWDSVKRFFGAAPEPRAGSFAARASKDLEHSVRSVALALVKKNESFGAAEIAEQIAPGAWQEDDAATAADVLERLFEQKFFEPFEYSKTWREPPIAAFLYHPIAAPPSASAPANTPPKPAPAPAAKSSQGVTTSQPSPSPVAGAAYRSSQNPYAAPGILSLSPDEMRARALKINPHRTAWIGRTDTIPPQSDERTALIDRGLILRGLLSEQQIAEIHQVGDEWIKYSKHWQEHRRKVAEATIVGKKTADSAMEELRKQKAALRAEKKRVAADRRRKHQEDVARRKLEDIVFLGRGVSTGLADRRSNLEALQTRGLPVLATPADVARALGITVPKLRWLCFHHDAMQRTHYVQFEIPKRSGGMRTLSAPHETLAKAQAWVLRDVLAKLATEEPAHGFVAKRSTVSNASPHVGRDLVINLDLSDFFPSIRFPRVRGVFHRLGYSPAVATVLALLCTESPRRMVTFEGAVYWVAVGERALPQGACTSPAISNQVARKIDRRLAGMAKRHGWTYTRYADDLTFSVPAGHRESVAMLLARVRHIVDEEGFALNPKKGRLQRAGGRQTVTGIVVNRRVSVPREEVRRIRAILHGAKKTGLDAQNRESRPHFEAWLRGKIAYVSMVDRARGEKLLREFEAARSVKASQP